jgi:hypothetical protein
MDCTVLGIGVVGPGLPDWPAARAVLRGERAYAAAAADEAQTAPAPALLPLAERRRATPPTRGARAAAPQALAAAGLDAAQTARLASVFASSSGSAGILHEICSMLAAGDDQISPIKFHNSVHNATSGYFTIAAGSMRAASSLCAYDGSAAAGLLEAVAQVADSAEPALLVAFDTPYPFPLAAARHIEGAWAIALLLGPADRGTGAAARLRVSIEADGGDGAHGAHDAAGALADAGLEAARLANPAARLLPLLAALARDAAAPARVTLPSRHGGALRIDIA